MFRKCIVIFIKEKLRFRVKYFVNMCLINVFYILFMDCFFDVIMLGGGGRNVDSRCFLFFIL